MTSLEAAIRLAMDARAESIFTAMPAKVLAYDSAAQTVSCQPMVKRPVRKADGSRVFEQLPDLPCARVVWTGGGGCSITTPLVAGDFVLLVIPTWDPSAWIVDGILSEPCLFRPHYLGGAFAIPCVRPMGKEIDPDAAAANAVVIDGPEIVMPKEATSPAAKGDISDDNFAKIVEVLVAIGGAGTGDAIPAAVTAKLSAWLPTASVLPLVACDKVKVG